jgi:hypothetical protein
MDWLTFISNLVSSWPLGLIILLLIAPRSVAKLRRHIRSVRGPNNFGVEFERTAETGRIQKRMNEGRGEE